MLVRIKELAESLATGVISPFEFRERLTFILQDRLLTDDHIRTIANLLKA